MRWVYAACMLLAMGCTSSGDLLDCEDGEDCDGQEELVQNRARGVGVDHMALYQSVKVPLVEDGSAVSSDIPIVAGKEAMIRVFLTRVSGFDSRDIVGRLTIDSGGDEDAVYEVTMNVSAGWSESNLDSTMNFTVAAEDMTPSSRFSLELLEAEVGFEGDEEEINAVLDAVDASAGSGVVGAVVVAAVYGALVLVVVVVVAKHIPVDIRLRNTYSSM